MRILYIMQVDWNWIKQRPQYLAEKLSKNHEVTVVYPKQRNQTTLCNNETQGLRRRSIFQIPGQGRFTLARKLSYMYTSFIIHHQINSMNPDVVWIGSPSYIRFLPKKIKGIVYDCMDDYYAMSKNRNIFIWEAETCKRAELIFASSLSLVEKLKDRYDVDPQKIHLVRNGFEAENFSILEQMPHEEFHIGYVGTISEWFDYESIEYVTSRHSNIFFDLYGPYKESERAKHSSQQILFHGTIEHSKIYDHVKELDCLIMPFILNEIIESVDPVKLYEYISFGKNILSVRYNEIERFKDFVFFYNTREELEQHITSLQANNLRKYTDIQKEEFLNDNSWGSRVKVVNSLLDRL